MNSYYYVSSGPPVWSYFIGVPVLIALVAAWLRSDPINRRKR